MSLVSVRPSPFALLLFCPGWTAQTQLLHKMFVHGGADSVLNSSNSSKKHKQWTAPHDKPLKSFMIMFEFDPGWIRHSLKRTRQHVIRRSELEFLLPFLFCRTRSRVTAAGIIKSQIKKQAWACCHRLEPSAQSGKCLVLLRKLRNLLFHFWVFFPEASKIFNSMLIPSHVLWFSCEMQVLASSTTESFCWTVETPLSPGRPRAVCLRSPA